MHSATVVASVAAFGLSLVSASPMRRQAPLSACANITQQYQEAVAANSSGLFVDGELAYDCLTSMPFDPERGSAFVVEIAKYLEFQSTTEFLKNPPDSYLSPAVDLSGGIEEIYNKANGSQYTSQYQMDTDLLNLFQSANDGHLSAQFCSMGIFSFSQKYSLVSISDDGVTLPKLYTLSDARRKANGSEQISDIVQINGQNATEYLLKLGLTQPNQDPDAQWNDLFVSQAKAVSGQGDASFGAFFSWGGMYPGSPTVSFTFANGSTTSTRIIAGITLDSFNYTDGQSLFEAACLPSNTTSGETPTTTASATATTEATGAPTGSSSTSVAPTFTAGPTGYPEPAVRDPYNLISGYYLEGEGYNDTAVLFIPTFNVFIKGLPETAPATFAEVASVFVNQAVADGKTKMVIDLSGNGGGEILRGFDLFKLFFPEMEAYSATRQRDHEAQRLMVQSWSNISEENSFDNFDNSFNYQIQVTPDQNESFATWEDFWGPDVTGPANMTNLYANFNYTLNSLVTDPIRGYGGVPLNVTQQPFAPENILVVTDGFCQSTCATFVNLMTNPQFGGVKSLALGGRPVEAPMQAMGGTRGAQSVGWDYLSTLAAIAYQNAVNQTNSTDPILTPEETELFFAIGPNTPESFPLVLAAGNLNLRNSYNPDDFDTPLQFAYQAADCKLFYTYENVIEPGTAWYAAADAIWGNGTCVTGSQSTNTTTR